MAELLIIPALAMLGLYSINSEKKEGYKNPNDLLNIQDSNYPLDLPINNPDSDTTITSRLSTINQYDGGPAYTDKFFDTEFRKPDKGGVKYQSLTGLQEADYFAQHNNTTPFFGSKSRDIHAHNNVNEGLLDNMVGSGSQIITKREITPMFEQKSDVSWANNMPNTSEFVRSRMAVSKSMNNVNPFPQQRVAPGIGLGGGTEGQGGFNSGLLAREQWIDRSVDELRAHNNPKASGLLQLGHEGPAGAYVKNQMIEIGRVEKNRQETTFELDELGVGPAMSYVKGNGVHGKVIDRFVNRPETDQPYTGIAGSTTEGMQMKDGEYMPTHRIQLGPEEMGPAYSNQKRTNVADFGLRSAYAYPTNREANRLAITAAFDDDYFGIIGQTIGSILAPITDVLKPNRKNNAVGTLRPYQNATSSVKSSYITNPHDITTTTNREMEREYRQNLWTVNASQYQKGDGYASTPVTASNTMRNQTIDSGRSNYIGGGSSSTKYGDQYDSVYETSNGIKDNIISKSGYSPSGNMSTFNANMNVFSDPQRQNMMMRSGQFMNAPKTFNQAVPDKELIGRQMGGDYLYDGMQLDRNTHDTMGDILKQNPYAIKSLSQI
jgi:hypothetical protein